MKPTVKLQSINEQLNHLEVLVGALMCAETDRAKLEILNREQVVKEFVDALPSLQTFLDGLSPACDLVIKSILAIGQGPQVFQQMASLDAPFEKLQHMLEILLPLEKFYAHLGGIVGYHTTFLKLLMEREGPVSAKHANEEYSKPQGLDLSHQTPLLFRAIRQGIEALPRLAEIYPVGGAGDRLQLCDECSGEPLPVAHMQFDGRSLLAGLVGDLQAREYLYYKLTGRQTLTPIAMMTSHEKGNHAHILAMCEEAAWFGRPKDAFRFFIQPLVPVISEEGNWCLSEALKLILKPGGHGVMWKLARDEGIFDWFEQLQRSKVLVRQINNPIAGIDIGLLAFCGIGFAHDKAFGFASCFRVLNTAEGMNVLVERHVPEGYACAITNIEYTDFAKKGIKDIPVEAGSNYSAFPANTNILLADLAAIRKAIDICPIPGTIINVKNKVDSLNINGQIQQTHAGRLESTMQNVADHIVDLFPQPITLAEQAQLKTYVTYNHRHRTISVTKKNFKPGESILETPEG